MQIRLDTLERLKERRSELQASHSRTELGNYGKIFGYIEKSGGQQQVYRLLRHKYHFRIRI